MVNLKSKEGNNSFEVRNTPYAGITRIRFFGSDLSLSAPLSYRRQNYNFFSLLTDKKIRK